MDTSPQISLAQAFAHCASTGSYWGWMIGILIASALVLLGMKIYQDKANTEINPVIKIIIRAVVALAIAASIFGRPCNVAVNTSQDAAARGHYSGY